MSDMQIEIYQSEDGVIELNVQLEEETVWLSQAQMVELFGRDQIISVGYHVKSQRGTQFRQWATQTLKQHLVQVYTLNQKRLQNNMWQFEEAVALIKQMMQTKELTLNESKGLLDVIIGYAKTWLLLQKHDENDLPQTLSTGKKLFVLDYPEATQAIAELKRELMYQRIGAFMFILFLAKNDLLYEANGTCKINDNALTALALLIAQSDPKAKELMIGLVVSLVGEG